MTDEKEQCSKCCHGINRRRAIELGVQTVSAIGLLSVASQLLPACGTQQPLSPGTGNSGTGGSSTPVATGTPTTTTNSSTNTSTNTSTQTTGVFFSFASNPSLQQVGGSIAANLNTSGGTQPVFITRASSTSAVTVSQICTHDSCNVNAYNASTKQYYCACHGSIFSVSGSVIRGPAASPLPTFQTDLSSIGVTVTPT